MQGDYYKIQAGQFLTSLACVTSGSSVYALHGMSSYIMLNSNGSWYISSGRSCACGFSNSSCSFYSKKSDAALKTAALDTSAPWQPTNCDFHFAFAA
jgi:hypothetical protein